MPVIMRIETPSGYGLYSGDTELKKAFNSILDEVVEETGISLDDLTDDDSLHPPPSYDLNLRWKNLYNDRQHLPWFFGFANMIQMKKWTINKRVRQLLHAYGYKLNYYSVPKRMFRAGELQAIFVKEKATLLHSMPVTMFD